MRTDSRREKNSSSSRRGHRFGSQTPATVKLAPATSVFVLGGASAYFDVNVLTTAYSHFWANDIENVSTALQITNRYTAQVKSWISFGQTNTGHTKHDQVKNSQ